jgi:hypothetical protein
MRRTESMIRKESMMKTGYERQKDTVCIYFEGLIFFGRD